MEAKNVAGPITIIQGKIDNQVIKFAAELTLRYSDNKHTKGKIAYGISIHSLNEFIIVDKIKEEKIKQYIL